MKNTKYFKYLIHSDAILESELQSFNNTILDLLNNKSDNLAIILKCHLIIEHYIDIYLEASYPTIEKWKNLRLTFSQKLELINNSKTAFSLYYTALKELNTIRNKFSHKLNYSMSQSDYKEINKIMSIWNDALQKPKNQSLNLIIEFTIHICSHLYIITNGIEKHAKGLGLSNYLEWLKDMLLPEEREE